MTTSKPDELLPGFTRSVPLNIHKNSLVIIPNTFSKSCVLFGHFSGQQIETSILPRVVLANEINKKYFFSTECLLVVV